MARRCRACPKNTKKSKKPREGDGQRINNSSVLLICTRSAGWSIPKANKLFRRHGGQGTVEIFPLGIILCSSYIYDSSQIREKCCSPLSGQVWPLSTSVLRRLPQIDEKGQRCRKSNALSRNSAQWHGGQDARYWVFIMGEFGREYSDAAEHIQHSRLKLGPERFTCRCGIT